MQFGVPAGAGRSAWHPKSPRDSKRHMSKVRIGKINSRGIYACIYIYIYNVLNTVIYIYIYVYIVYVYNP